MTVYHKFNNKKKNEEKNPNDKQTFSELFFNDKKRINNYDKFFAKQKLNNLTTRGFS